MRAIYDIITSYLNGTPMDAMVAKHPYAEAFVARTYEWLGPVNKLSDAQKLKLERFLIPFDLWVKTPVWRSGFEPDGDALVQTVLNDLEGKSGRGAKIDATLKELGEAPLHGMPHKHGVCDCHQNTFRYFEKWIYRIGTGDSTIPTRKSGVERERAGRLLFAYSLALDKWLMGKPMQFLLLDLGHVDLGFDPKNEILRVYAYLGEERSPMKQWLVACLWYAITYNGIFIDPDYKIALGRAHKGIVEKAESLGISVREWMDSKLGERPEYR